MNDTAVTSASASRGQRAPSPSRHEDLVEHVVLTGANTWTVVYVGSQTTHDAVPVASRDPHPSALTEAELEAEFAVFADDTLAWARQTAGAVSDAWPDA